MFVACLVEDGFLGDRMDVHRFDLQLVAKLGVRLKGHLVGTRAARPATPNTGSRQLARRSEFRGNPLIVDSLHASLGHSSHLQVPILAKSSSVVNHYSVTA